MLGREGAWGIFYSVSSEEPHLFKPFYRGSNVDNIQGTGLGLAIVGRCVEAHKGQIHLESEEGKGTKITVILPIITDIEHLNWDQQ